MVSEATLGRPAANAEVRAREFRPHVGHVQPDDLADPQAAAAGQAEDDQVQPRIPRPRGLAMLASLWQRRVIGSHPVAAD